MDILETLEALKHEINEYGKALDLSKLILSCVLTKHHNKTFEVSGEDLIDIVNSNNTPHIKKENDKLIINIIGE